MITRAFRPQAWSGRFCLREHVGKYHWWERRPIETHKLRAGARLHYLACHAPGPVQLKWKSAWNNFIKRYRKSI